MQIRLSIKQGIKMLNSISQTKLLTKLQNCKHCLAIFVLFLLVVVPHNISAVCSSDVDLDSKVIINVDYVEWNQKMPAYVTIAGAKYASSKVSDGLFSSSYQQCTGSDGNSRYTLSGPEAKAAGACPAGSTLQPLPDLTGHPTPTEVDNAIGKTVWINACRDWQIVLQGTDSNADRYAENTITASTDWLNHGSSGERHHGFPLCKLDFQ